MKCPRCPSHGITSNGAGRDMDLLELSAYGNVRRGQDSDGCKIQ